VGWDWRDDRFNPRSGIYLDLSPSYLGGLNDESPGHLRFEGRVNAYVPLFFESTLALSLVYQHIFETSGSDVNIPVNRRLFGGGRSTIRGYQERTLFPQDLVLCEGGVPPVPGFTCRGEGDKLSPGGLLVFAMKAELRFPLFEGLSLTAFYDIGDVFLEPSNFFLSLERSDRGQTRQGVGAGLRYDTPIGPIILDIGVPLVRRNDPNEVDWTPHFAAVGTF
jgi:outer membrane protein assembly factor BamA